MCFCNQNCAPAAIKVFLQTTLCSYSQQCVFLQPSLCSCCYHYFSAANTVFLQAPVFLKSSLCSCCHHCVPAATIEFLNPPLYSCSHNCVLAAYNFVPSATTVLHYAISSVLLGFRNCLLYITLCSCRYHCVTLLPQVPLWRGRGSDGSRHALLWRLWVELCATQMCE